MRLIITIRRSPIASSGLVIFFSTKFQDCKMTGSNFIETNLSGITIIAGDWSYVHMNGCYFKGLDLRLVKFKQANLFKANLEKADLRGADFTQAILSGASLKGADLRGAKIDGVDVKSLDLNKTKIDLTQAVIIAEAYGAVYEEG